MDKLWERTTEIHANMELHYDHKTTQQGGEHRQRCFDYSQGSRRAELDDGRNATTGSCYSVIGNGVGNIICATSCYSFIGSGCCNAVSGVGAVLIGGLCNTSSGFGSFIGNGGYNIASGEGATVVNGTCNQALANLSFIGGGGVNPGAAPLGNFINALSGGSSIVGGSCNCIGETTSSYASTFGFIGGGLGNFIDSTGTASSYGVIGGGRGNVICAGANYSSILNGADNTNSGNYSAILGGSGNVIPAGCSYVGVFGQGITAVCSNAFHVNCLVAQNIPITSNPTTCAPPSGAITGTLYYVPVGSWRQVWVAP